MHVLPFADAIVSSLTKVFSGDSNVMGGRYSILRYVVTQPLLTGRSLILNPQGRFYEAIKKAMEEDYEDKYWLEDAIFMERNSRDFVSRIERINGNAEAICEVLRVSPTGKCSGR